MSFLCWVERWMTQCIENKEAIDLAAAIVRCAVCGHGSLAEPGNDILDTVSRHPLNDDLLSINASDNRMNMAGIRIVDRETVAMAGSEQTSRPVSRRPQDDLLCEMD